MKTRRTKLIKDIGKLRQLTIFDKNTHAIEEVIKIKMQQLKRMK